MFSAHTLTIDNVRDQIVGIEAQVPLLDGSHRQYVYLDNSASTPVLRPVFDTVNAFMIWYSSVHRGTGFKSQIATRAYDDAHRVVLDFVGGDPAVHTVIFGKNSTEALNKLARRLPWHVGDVVLTTLMEHHSNDLPWRMMAHTEHVAVDDTGRLDEAHLDHLLQRYAGRVRLLAVTGASNVTGYVNPVRRLAERAHAAGAEILVDAAQLAPHRAVDMGTPDDPGHIDYLVISAHKMYAPYGTGALVGPRATFLQGTPDLVGGGTVDIVTLDQVQWAGLPDREEAGSPNVVGAVALARAVLCLQEIGMEAVSEHEARLTAYLLRRMAVLDRVHIYGSADPDATAERVGVVSFNVEGMNHFLVAAILSAEAGIGVRSGCFCAHPYMLHLLGIDPAAAEAHSQEIARGDRSHLPGMVRASLGCYSNEADADCLISVLGKITRGEYAGHYVQDPEHGTYWPVDFAPDPSAYFSMRANGGLG